MLLSAAYLQASNYSTEVIGFVDVTVQGKPLASGGGYIAPSFVQHKEFEGICDERKQNPYSVKVTGAAWRDSQFDLSENYHSHYVEVLQSENPSAVGLVSDITSHSADTLFTADDLSSYTVGEERIVIRSHATLNTLFGRLNQAGFQAGDEDTADIVSVLKSGANPEYEDFYFKQSDNSMGWRRVGDPATNVGDWPIPVHSGLHIQRRGNTDLTLRLSGVIATGPRKIRLKEGLNIIDPLIPSAKRALLPTVTLGTSELENSISSDLHLALRSGGHTNADSVSIHDGAFSFDTYYLKSGESRVGGNGWRLTYDPFTVQNETVLTAGKALLIHNRGPEKVWIRPQVISYEELYR